MPGRCLSALCVVAVVWISGCSNQAPIGSVDGTVSYNSTPIESGTIVFEVSGARPATGKIENGKLVAITTNDPGDGVPVGLAKIAIYATEPVAQTPAKDEGSRPGAGAEFPSPGEQPDASFYSGLNAKSIIPAKYNDPSTSGLTFEIKPGENTIELDLEDD